MHPALAEHLRKRWMRPDAYRFAALGTPEAKPPGYLHPWAEVARQEQAAADEVKARALAEQDAFEREVLALRHDFAKLKLDYELRRFQRKYSPDQPRVPAGNSDGGQWTSEGGEGAGRGQVLSDETPESIIPGAQYAANATQRPYSVNLDAPRGTGHTQRDHVAKSDEQLIATLQEDWLR
jgi:hypothetical protein